jgi:uncharacterized protein YndB with AHSA1/START domain
MSSTRVARLIRAPRASVYRALLDPEVVEQWRRFPDGMTAEVHEFDASEGGAFRVSLTYDAPTETGKTSAQIDTYHGCFARLVPDEQVVEVIEFETTDPDLLGEMTITTTLADAEGGTEVVLEHEGIPRGVSAVDNKTGTRMALDNLARVVETS